jgi:lysozyme
MIEVRRVCMIPLALVACASASTNELDQAATVCGAGPTVKGIDVSLYQGTIDWNAVANDGVQFAFIRVSDGVGTVDSRFAANWSGSRAAGIVHGAYQFFRPDVDPIAQADLLLSQIDGGLQPDDLPPAIDVEVTDGLDPSAVAAAVKAWVDHVAAAIGRPPIIYTGFYFWHDSVGGPDMTTSPLWHAQYTSASCPNIAAPWTEWAVWQYSGSGTVGGIGAAVDLDVWNGDRASLMAFLGGSGAGSCGDGTCQSYESKLSCPEDCGPCGTIANAGGQVTSNDACFVDGGPAAGLHRASDAGQGGSLVWTHATDYAAEQNYATWNLYLAEAGTYRVSVATPAAYARSKHAEYVVHAKSGDTTVTIDQSAVDGWQSLGDFTFGAGGHQYIHLGDNTGEPRSQMIDLAFDGVKLERSDGGKTDGEGTVPRSGGCAAGGGGGFAIALALVGLRRRRSSASARGAR